MMLIGFLMSIVSGFALLLLLERSPQLSALIVRFAAVSLPEQTRSDHQRQWLADIEFVEGNTWKLVTSVAIVWACRYDILAKYAGLKFPRPYLILTIPGTTQFGLIAFTGDFSNHAMICFVAGFKRALTNFQNEEEGGDKPQELQEVWEDFYEPIREFHECTEAELYSKYVFRTHLLPPNLERPVFMCSNKDGPDN